MKMWTEILLLFGTQTEEMPQGAARERKFINLKLMIIEPIYEHWCPLHFYANHDDHQT
jgi:hypothetical protein